MPFVAFLIGPIGRYLLLAVALVGGLAYLHHKVWDEGRAAGYAEGHAEYTTLKTSYQEAAAKQAQATAAITTKQTEVTVNATTSYETQLTALRAKYDRLRNQAGNNSSGGNVSKVPDATSRPDDTGPQPASDNVCIASDAAEDALKLTGLQHWVLEQQRANP